MKEFFEQVFSGFGLSEEKLNGLYADFSTIVLLKLIGVSKDKLSESEAQQIGALIDEKKIDDVYRIVRGKYSDQEWDDMAAEHVTPIFEEYLSEVVIPSAT